jgi:hypothetical protein
MSQPATVIDLEAYRARCQQRTPAPPQPGPPVIWFYWVPVWLWH